ncbi:MAG: RNA-binding S4 domain-containing protein [Bacteroidetes bacterium]|nr:MAG: RNA-binding S4 domain-containing protein [Bacteroidota bacterium]
MRIDKFLWAVRLFKTRSLAADACKNEKVKIGGMNLKSSREIKIGDKIEVKDLPIWRSYEIIGITEQRVGAKLVTEFIKDITPTEELAKLEAIKNSGFIDNRKGRPTKKDRRQLGDWLEL